MNLSNTDLTAQALALPLGQRIELAQQLWNSIGGPEPAWTDEEIIKEALRRDAEITAGLAETFTHEEVMRDARKAIGCE